MSMVTATHATIKIRHTAGLAVDYKHRLGYFNMQAGGVLVRRFAGIGRWYRQVLTIIILEFLNMVVKNILAFGIMCALAGCATKPVSNEQATPVPEKQVINSAILEKEMGQER